MKERIQNTALFFCNVASFYLVPECYFQRKNEKSVVDERYQLKPHSPPFFFLLVLDTDLIFYRSIMALAIDTMVLRASH